MVNTNTTHDKYIPPYETPKYGIDTEDNHMKSLFYSADLALNYFLNELKKLNRNKPLYVVAIADNTYRAHPDPLKNYSVPFFILKFKDGKIDPSLAKHVPVIASQYDIAPTLADLLGYQRPKNWVGRSLLGDTSNIFALYYRGGNIGWIQDKKLVETSMAHSHKRCYQHAHEGFIFKTIPCNEEFEELIDNAHAFTHETQKFLFKGDTKSFRYQ